MHNYTVNVTLNKLDVDVNNGLTDKQVDLRIARYGNNCHKTAPKRSVLNRFFSQFADLMIIILLIASALSLAVALIRRDTSELLEPVIIVAIVVINAVLGTVQECKAEHSLQALAKLTSPKTKVLRNGTWTEVDSALITVGDVVSFDSGDVITADCRIVESVNLFVNESALTGESLPVGKNHKAVLPADTPVAERVNVVFGGSYVTNGHCIAVVYGVADNTEVGKIATLLTDEQAPSPLQVKLKQLSKVIGIVCLSVCGAVLVLGFVKALGNRQQGDSVTEIFVDVFLTSVSLAVAAIPEGLPAVVTIVLSRSVERMAKRNAVVKSLPCVEALGCADVICTDKTGTLTQNVMTLTAVYTEGKYVTSNFKNLDVLKYYSMCCNVTKDETNYYGDPTEVAVCKVTGIADCTRIAELPFDSQRKLMSVAVRHNGEEYSVTKGSYDSMLCADNAQDYRSYYVLMSSKGLRVLALSVTKYNGNLVYAESHPHIVALVAVFDPPRSNTKQAVTTCVSAGIVPVMITGDSPETAKSIAYETGILRNGKVVDGITLQNMTDEQLTKQVKDISVYARVNPSDKLRIVRAWQNTGATVAMTGDGVNDAPALKRADIGCAMGSGTEVAKNSADIILADDNFATIIYAVEEGRNVHFNIRNAVRYLLTCNIGEVLTVFFALVIWGVAPLGAMQLLWINLVTDGLPSIAVSSERCGSEVMTKPPLGKTDFFHKNKVSVAVEGGIFAIITLVAYAIGNAVSVVSAQTMAFTVLSLSQLFFAVEVCSQRSVFVKVPSLFMLLSLAFGVMLVALVTVVPQVASVFGLTVMPVQLYFVALALSAVPLIGEEIARLPLLRQKNSSGNI